MQDDPSFAAEFGEYSFEERLHNVPPHEVSEVVVDGQRAVYKRDVGPTGSAGVEGRVAALVGAETSVPVPAVLAVGDDWYVAAYCHHAPSHDSPSEPDEAWARAAGRGLATLHEESAALVNRYGAFHVDGNVLAGPSHSNWREAALAFVRRRRDVMADHGHADVADAALDFLRENPDAFAAAGDPVVCHGWWSPEHVAVQDRDIACVLDFEHALAAPATWDYWRTVLAVFDGGPAQAAFREGYESVRRLPADLANHQSLYTLLHALYFFESLYVQTQHGDAETERRANALREQTFEMLEAAR